jgi:chemotaxis protein MotB
MADKSEQPIIIRRKKVMGHAHHGGAWKVAFADFMTAMMAFFLVMWLVGQKPEVREAVSGFFRDPGKFKQEGSSGVLRGSKAAIPAPKQTIGLMQPPKKDEKYIADMEKKELMNAGMAIIKQLEKEEAFKKLRKNVKIELTSEGLRIVLNESEDSPAFFEPGSAKLLQQSAIILVTIARELGKLKNRLVMEGHTTADGAKRGDYSNWELSADRANSARQLMDVSGLYHEQVREVRGFADQLPMFKQQPNDARNRRVSILVLYQASEHDYEQVEIGDDLMNATDSVKHAAVADSTSPE